MTFSHEFTILELYKVHLSNKNQQQQTKNNRMVSFPSLINNEVVINAMTDWDSGRRGGGGGWENITPRGRLSDGERQHNEIRNWLAYIRSCGVSSQAPYGEHFRIMRLDYVRLDYSCRFLWIAIHEMICDPCYSRLNIRVIVP